MKKCLLILLLLLLLPCAAPADTAWVDVPTAIGPEDAVFTFTYDGDSAAVCLLDTSGQVLLSSSAMGGGSGVFAPGTLPQGTYILRLTAGDAIAQRRVQVVRPAILSADAPEEYGEGWSVRVEVNCAGTVVLALPDGTELARAAASPGWTEIPCAARLPAGGQTLCLRLVTRGSVTADDPLYVRVPAGCLPAHDAAFFSPDDLSGVTCGHDVCYWKLNMGEMDEAAVWQVLTAPVTVLSGDERHQYKVRREPSKSCKDYVGEVTYASQAVHVLERGDEWSLIEAYSSSVEGSSVKVWARQFRGYVETKLLREAPVSQNVGLVIDKLQQRLYVYKDGRLYSTLLCSTGFARADTPFNESPAGEFLAISWTGGFWSGSLYCDMAIRINDGILLHEVPCTVRENADGSTARSYERCERYLGEKASHGCIRIQRALTPERVNAKWLWDNLPRSGAKVKVIIWDDWGRTLAYPGDDLALYYNPKGGKYYHSAPNCAEVNEKYWPLTAFPYGDLETGAFARLTPCPACAPQLRHAAIDTLNTKNTRGK